MDEFIDTFDLGWINDLNSGMDSKIDLYNSSDSFVSTYFIFVQTVSVTTMMSFAQTRASNGLMFLSTFQRSRVFTTHTLTFD